jgi:hypothetical protein
VKNEIEGKRKYMRELEWDEIRCCNRKLTAGNEHDEGDKTWRHRKSRAGNEIRLEK